LKGSYNFTLSFSGIGQMSGGGGGGGGGAAPAESAQQASDPNGAVSLFDAIKNELGVKLEKVTRPAPVFVIDHIEEQPTAN
jgi:uncharacterized protein (TIGR03435 family)